MIHESNAHPSPHPEAPFASLKPALQAELGLTQVSNDLIVRIVRVAGQITIVLELLHTLRQMGVA
jgi:hypothetical protein